MIKASERVMRAFTMPEGIVIKQFLEECLAEQDRYCRGLTGEGVYRAQGAALELQEIIDLANNARDALESS